MSLIFDKVEIDIDDVNDSFDVNFLESVNVLIESYENEFRL